MKQPQNYWKTSQYRLKTQQNGPYPKTCGGARRHLKICTSTKSWPSAPLVFIGSPGVGKTVYVAKLAALTRLTGHEAHLISTDTIRAGTIDQLNVYADRLGLILATTALGDSRQARSSPTQRQVGSYRHARRQSIRSRRHQRTHSPNQHH